MIIFLFSVSGSYPLDVGKSFLLRWNISPPVYLPRFKFFSPQTRKLLSSSSPGTHQCPSTGLARLIMLDVIKIRVNANCSINIYIGSNLIFSSHSYYILTTRLKKILEQTNFSVLWVPGAGTVNMTTPNTERVLKRIRMLRGQSFALVPIPINLRSIAGLVSSRTRTSNIGGITMNPSIVQVTDN